MINLFVMRVLLNDNLKRSVRQLSLCDLNARKIQMLCWERKKSSNLKPATFYWLRDTILPTVKSSVDDWIFFKILQITTLLIGNVLVSLQKTQIFGPNIIMQKKSFILKKPKIHYQGKRKN
jgi:hypothetical protein